MAAGSEDKAQLLKDGGGPKRVRYFSGRAAVGLGATLISFGLIVIAAQIAVLVVYRVFFHDIAQGLWCGVAFILTGTVGIIAGKRRTSPWIIAHLVLCIIVCLFAASLIGLSAIATVMNSVFGSAYTYKNPCSGQIAPVNQAGYTSGYTGGYYTGYYTSYYTSYYTGGYGTGSTGSTGSSGTGHWTSGWTSLWTGYWTGSYYTSYYSGYSGYFSRFGNTGCYVLNVPWVVQFSMNVIMASFGIFSAIIAIIAGTLSCAPICCNPDKKRDIESPPTYAESPPYYQLPTTIPVDVVCIDVPTGASHM